MMRNQVGQGNASAKARFMFDQAFTFFLALLPGAPPDPLFEGVAGSQMHASFGAQQKAKSDVKNTAIRQLANGQKIYVD